jgi:rRNA processing protein Krr1/Pno1
MSKEDIIEFQKEDDIKVIKDRDECFKMLENANETKIKLDLSILVCDIETHPELYDYYFLKRTQMTTSV